MDVSGTPLQIVSVERYLNYETKEDVAQEFGFKDSNHYTPWPIVLPTDDDSIQRIEDQANSESIHFRILWPSRHTCIVPHRSSRCHSMGK